MIALPQLDQRAGALAARNAYSTIGIFLGVVAGGSMAAAMPTSLLAAAAPGWLNVIVSLVMLCWLTLRFADRDMLPVSPPKGSDAVELPPP